MDLNTIFTINIPLSKTNEELDKLKKQFDKYDPYYIVSGSIEERKLNFDKLWGKYKVYADKHFLSQIKYNFHQRTWEMYLGNVLLKNFSIVSNNEGPDFIIDNTIYIECIAPTKGDSDKINSVPEMTVAKSFSEMIVQNVPVDKMILRMTQCIKDKAIIQYKNWKTKKWFNKNASFIIAINTGDLGNIQDYLGIPLIIKALFGLQFLQINQKGKKSFSWRNQINKGAGVPVDFFTNNDFDFISGIIFSDSCVINNFDNLGKDCVFVNNPFAVNPVDFNFIEKFKYFDAKIDEDKIEIKKKY